MATEFFNEAETPNGEAGGQSDGSKLRAQLEAALKSNKDMQAKLSTYEVREFLGGKQLDLVKPEELAGVDPTKWDETATRIQTERTEMQKDLLRRALTAQGLDQETVDQMVAGTVTSTAQADEAQAINRVRQAGSVAATPPLAVDPNKLHGLDAITAGLK